MLGSDDVNRPCALHPRDPGGCAVTNGWRMCVRFVASLCDAAPDLQEFAGML